MIVANTNFAALTDEQYTVWAREFWHEAVNRSMFMSHLGTGPGAMIRRVNELRTTKDGARAVMTLINRATGDGRVGDNQLKGNEEALRSSEFVIRQDQWRHAHADTGRMSNQKSIVEFRKEAKFALTRRAGEVLDELIALTLSGVAYTYQTNGATRTGSDLPDLEFGADVTAPSTNRYTRWDATNGLITTSASNADLVAGDTPTWEMLVDLKAHAVEKFIEPLSTTDGIDHYNVFMTPRGIAKLKKDADFLAAWQHAAKRGEDNLLFKGSPHGGKKGIYIDGLNILEYRNVFNTLGASGGSKWGGGAVDGQRVLLCGASALGYADINLPTWEEEKDDYNNRQGIATGKIFGLRKALHHSTYDNATEDFGVIVCDTAI